MRRALGMVWDLNIKAIPSAILWAISLWFIMETSSFLTRLTGTLLADLAVLLSGTVLAKIRGARFGVTLFQSLRDPFAWKALLPISVILCIAIQNAKIQESSSLVAKYFYSSMVLSSLILWLFVSVALIPARTFQGFRGDEVIALSRGVNLVKSHKGPLALSIGIILFGWPLFFVYIFLALTLAQCIIYPLIEEDLEDSITTPKMRDDLA